MRFLIQTTRKQTLTLPRNMRCCVSLPTVFPARSQPDGRV